MQSISPNQCYHCGLTVPDRSKNNTVVLGQTRSMCCPGCAAVAQAIVSNGLEDYYTFRTEFALKGDEQLEATLSALDAYDTPDIQDEFVLTDGTTKQIQLTVEGISCAACGWIIEKQLLRIQGIQRVAVDVSARRAQIHWQEDAIKLSDVIKKLESIGYKALPFQPNEHESSFKKEHRSLLKRLGLSGLMTMQVMMIAIGLYFGVFGSIEPETKTFLHWVSFVLTTPVVLYAGATFYVSAYFAIKNHSLNMDVSVSLAVIGTYIASAIATVTNTGDVYFESVCMFIFLLLVSRFLEQRTRYKASQISSNMLKYIPMTAQQQINGELVTVLAKHLKVDDVIVVKPGQTLPVDAQVIEGESQVDESMLTGESLPVTKQIGDKVFGGTTNLNGPLLLNVSAELKYALVNQILRMQELALNKKPTAARFADKASQHFVAIVLVIAGASFFGWMFIEPDRAFWIAIAILVATCPCALSLATPSVLTSAMAKLNEHGLLCKRADVLEQLIDVDVVVFDKTGTLTEGKFTLIDSQSVHGFDVSTALSIAAGLQQFSEHPMAKAFEDYAPFTINQIQTHIGQGVSGIYQGETVKVGKLDFVCDNDIHFTNSIEGNVFLSLNNQVIAVFKLIDSIKSDAQALTRYFDNTSLVLLSGDDEHAVNVVADTLNISTRKFRQTPSQKLNFIEQLQKQQKHVIMVGDGINDAPVLAAADVSIAVGSAADMAKKSADIILLSNQLANITELFVMARRVRKKIIQNLAWALGYNVAILPLAISGLLTPWMAVIGMSLSSIIVVTNSIRLLSNTQYKGTS